MNKHSKNLFNCDKPIRQSRCFSRLIIAIFGVWLVVDSLPALAQQDQSTTSEQTHENLTKATSPTSSSITNRKKDDRVEKEFNKLIKPFLKENCAKCHLGDKPKGDFSLQPLDSFQEAAKKMDAWESIYDALDTEFMPPENEKQPDPADKQKAMAWVKNLIQNGNPEPPTPVLRRLNRIEFERSISDLLRFNRKAILNPREILLSDRYFNPESGKMSKSVLAISYFTYRHRYNSPLDGIASIPEDPAIEHGFSNNGKSLSTSPLLMEKYFEFASTLIQNKNFPRVTNTWEELFVIRDGATIEEKIKKGEEKIASILVRAFRRPVTDSETKVFLDLFHNELKESEDYTQAIMSTVSAIIVSPGFLFRDDLAQTSDQFQQNPQFALASRMSYFLWGTMPDDELIEAASKGKLQSKEQLNVQLDRMLKSKKIKHLATDFGMQWLRLSKVNSAFPDKDLFPKYFQRRFAPLGVSMMIEQLLLFETIMVEDRSIIDFINADFSYINRDLMNLYGVKMKKELGFSPHNTNYEDFFRIKWSDQSRGGILTSGATLVSTSTPVRTSPVYRGAWVLDVVFNRPPPPPPGAVPAIRDDEDSSEQKNIRLRLEKHRDDPNCATCHSRIDPLGFLLEEYDPIGRKRSRYNDDQKIVVAGKHNGVPYSNVAEFKQILAKEKNEFVRAFVEHMMSYALGRSLVAADWSEIERITEKVIQNDCRFSSVVKEIVLSKQFQMMRNSSNN